MRIVVRPNTALRIHAATSLGLSGPTRNYWWSSKPAAPTGSIPGSEQNAALNALKDATSDASSVGAAGINSLSAPASTSQVGSASVNASADVGLSAANAASTAPLESAAVLPDVPLSSDALDKSIEALTALASTDYSHMFSWGWPSGLFLRLFSSLQDLPITVLAASPIACMIIAVLIMRGPLTYLQLKGQRAASAWAPYQTEFRQLSDQYKIAQSTGDQIRSMELAKRLMQIREEAKFGPFTSLLPAFGLLYVGIGSFIGMGKLAKYHREAVDLGAAGPLANPGGVFETGWLEHLDKFDPLLLGLFASLTFWNARRSALDAPRYTVWMTRMPWLITPLFAVTSLGFQFSSAQMIVGATSITFAIGQSYILRIPSVRRAVGMEGVKVQDPKTFKFPAPWTAYKDSWQDLLEWNREQIRNNMQAQQARDAPLPPTSVPPPKPLRTISAPPLTGIYARAKADQGPAAITAPPKAITPVPNASKHSSSKAKLAVKKGAQQNQKKGR